MATLHISEIFKLVGGAADARDKALLLKKYESAQLKQYLYISTCNAVEFAIPPEPATYIPFDVPVEQGETNLFREAKKLQYFLKNAMPGLQQAKRERLYTDLLSRLSKEEAQAMEDIRLRQLDKKYGISRSVVERAFSDVAQWLAKYSKPEEKPKPVLNAAGKVPRKTQKMIAEKPTQALSQQEIIDKVLK